MQSDLISIIAVILMGIILASLSIVAYTLREANKTLTREIKELKVSHEFELEKRNKMQRATVKGQIAEQMYPILPSCPYLLSDMRFIGHPIDYIIFDGLTDAKDNSGEIKEVIFADIKTGKASLSTHQRAIRDAIKEGRVRWLTIRADEVDP